MNLDLEPKNGILSHASSYDALDGVVIERKLEQAVLFSRAPFFKDVLKEMGQLPEEALFLGLADDGLPILLNLWDPIAGPLLVAGDSGAGKTDFLKVITHFVLSTHEPREIQYGVITAHPQEWQHYVNYPHCIGIFPAEEENVTDFLRALVAWIAISKPGRQSILLVIDELNDFVYWNSRLSRELRKILLYGPTNRIWPIVTLNLEGTPNVSPWLGYFHTRVFGYTKNASIIDYDGSHAAGFATLSKGIEFSLKENSQWIRFRIPRT